MSTPTTSTGPTPPGPTSNPVPLRGWFKAIIDWIKALSPAGATVYDTGWIQAQGTDVQYRRVGRTVAVSIDISGASGLTGDIVNLNGGAPVLPSSVWPPFESYGAGVATQPGVATHGATIIVTTSGVAKVVKPPVATTGMRGTVTYICG